MSGQTVELVTEASAPPQLVRRMGAWEDEQTTVLQNVVVTMGESFVHPEVEEQLLYAKNIGHEVRARFFKFYMEPKNRFHGINSVSLCSLAGRYDNPIPS